MRFPRPASGGTTALTGISRPIIRYPIPLDPPFVPHENPAGAYITEFEYSPEDAAPPAHLNFEGVDSCFYVWVNGEYVGYSQVSHATAEFDVTDQLVPGTNKLAVLVLKWCDGTYLEDQDKFRTSGIFRIRTYTVPCEWRTSMPTPAR